MCIHVMNETKISELESIYLFLSVCVYILNICMGKKSKIRISNFMVNFKEMKKCNITKRAAEVIK